MAPLYVGLDLGGSGTRAALADAEGSVLATGRGGPSGIAATAAGRRLLARSLDAALAPIAARVGSSPCVVHAGTRGLSLPGRRDTLLLELGTRFSNAEIHVSNDALIALWGGLAGRPGVAVLAGTGSIALARAADGREGRAGGWGYLLGDEGSGYWLGREAIAAYLQVLEGRRTAGPLAARIASATGARTVPEGIAWVNSGDNPVARLAGLAPLVSEAVDAGDEVARGILCRAGQALADLAAAAVGQIRPKGALDRVQVACCGGVWAAGAALTAPFREALADRLPGATVSPPLLPPVAGAIVLAMQKRPDAAVLDNLTRAFREGESQVLESGID
jgi:N-acetylglucosamine kinase-like BadF-type ATPase